MRLLTTHSQLKEYDVAASYFHQLAPFYAKDEWSNLDMVMLNMYAECLSHLQRTEDYVRVALRALAKMIQNSSGATGKPREGSADSLNTAQNPGYTTVSLKDIMAASTSLEQPVSVSMDQYFDHVGLDKYIQHFSDHDGFALLLKLRSLLPGSLEAQSVRVKLVSAGEEPRSELWLAVDSPQNIRTGHNQIKLRSKVSKEQVSKNLHVLTAPCTDDAARLVRFRKHQHPNSQPHLRQRSVSDIHYLPLHKI